MNRITRILLTAGVILFVLATFILIYLSNDRGIGPGLIGAAPCMAAACVCRALMIWQTERRRAVADLLYAAAMLAIAVYCAFI